MLGQWRRCLPIVSWPAAAPCPPFPQPLPSISPNLVSSSAGSRCFVFILVHHRSPLIVPVFPLRVYPRRVCSLYRLRNLLRIFFSVLHRSRCRYAIRFYRFWFFLFSVQFVIVFWPFVGEIVIKLRLRHKAESFFRYSTTFSVCRIFISALFDLIA